MRPTLVLFSNEINERILRIRAMIKVIWSPNLKCWRERN